MKYLYFLFSLLMLPLYCSPSSQMCTIEQNVVFQSMVPSTFPAEARGFETESPKAGSLVTLDSNSTSMDPFATSESPHNPRGAEVNSEMRSEEPGSNFSAGMAVVQFDLEDLEINKGGMFIFQKGAWVQLRTNVHNSDGSLTGSYSPLGLTCPNCGAYNGATSTECRKCGHTL